MWYLVEYIRGERKVGRERERLEGEKGTRKEAKERERETELFVIDRLLGTCTQIESPLFADSSCGFEMKR